MAENKEEYYLTADKAYPIKCFMRIGRDKFFAGALNFETIENQRLKNGGGFEHPCYSCTRQLDGNCRTPEVRYGDKNNRWKIPPKSENPVLT